ncbi:MAG: hypothetical protein EOS06_16725 [Mesorhizobium sp.]|nr:MAG: hypothetical protein EOS06_16725 [Mesorhizobium sp.]
MTFDRAAQKFARRRRDSTPLCPTGHLPLKGGDSLFVLLSPIADVEEEGAASKLARGRPAPIASRLRRGRCRGSPSRNYSRRRPRP